MGGVSTSAASGPVRLRETTGAFVLALRGRDGTFPATSPMPAPADAGYVLIAIGTRQQLAARQHPANLVR